MMTRDSNATSTEIRKVVGLVVGLTILLAVMLCAFALPAVHTGAHGVPVGVVGNDQVVATVSEKLDGFEVSAYPDADAAGAAILDRQIYGAFVVESGQVHTLVASAASSAAATAITQAGSGLAAAQHLPARVTDLRGFGADDPRGAGLVAGALPLALGGWIAAVVIMQVIGSTRERILAVLAFSVVGGLGMTAVIQFVLGTFDGNYWLTSLAAMLGIAATAMTVLGLRELMGAAGLGVAAVLLILLGNPLSGLASAPEMLPTPWGTIGQLLPPGATGSLLRDVAFFDGHGATHALIVLFCWLIGGMVLYTIGLRRSGSSENAPHPDEEASSEKLTVV
ncbi:hypothetical protein [Gordonia bronchialis]|uniref:hypothetical protein n=1 Tax=Gordonia bronchialis TaxID=2054 RepID=UPI00226F2C70|nr:hypothetical protein [Gordonia bronchialis]